MSLPVFQRLGVPARSAASRLEVRLVSTAVLPTRFGEFQLVAFANNRDGKDHVALVKGEVDGAEAVLCRLHSECLTGDAFGSLRCDCRDQLEHAMKRVQEAGRGVILYLRQEGRGIGLANKVRAYALQDQGMDTVEANLALGFRDDERDYEVAARMLDLLGIQSVRLMTNNPNKVSQLAAYGVQVSDRQAHELPANPHNARYLRTKLQRSGHLLSLPGPRVVSDDNRDVEVGEDAD